VRQLNSLQPGDILVVPSYTMPELWTELGTFARKVGGWALSAVSADSVLDPSIHTLSDLLWLCACCVLHLALAGYILGSRPPHHPYIRWVPPHKSGVRVLIWQLQLEGTDDCVPLPTPFQHVGHSVWITEHLELPHFGPSRLGVLTPHLSPSFLERARRREQDGLEGGKRELLVVDGDVHWGAIDPTNKVSGAWGTVHCTSYSVHIHSPT
jgi:hypothetical protein